MLISFINRYLNIKVGVIIIILNIEKKLIKIIAFFFSSLFVHKTFFCPTECGWVDQ
jgi:hypothetical protein